MPRHQQLAESLATMVRSRVLPVVPRSAMATSAGIAAIVATVEGEEEVEIAVTASSATAGGTGVIAGADVAVVEPVIAGREDRPQPWADRVAETSQCRVVAVRLS